LCQGIRCRGDLGGTLLFRNFKQVTDFAEGANLNGPQFQPSEEFIYPGLVALGVIQVVVFNCTGEIEKLVLGFGIILS
jgi:hypothetical protein